jgi:hypothetical protein
MINLCMGVFAQCGKMCGDGVEWGVSVGGNGGSESESVREGWGGEWRSNPTCVRMPFSDLSFSFSPLTESTRVDSSAKRRGGGQCTIND